MKAFAPVLFMGPAKNIRLLHRVFVDEIASGERWNMFINILNSRLKETNILVSSPHISKPGVD